MQYGVFADPDSPRTRLNKKSASFNVTVGPSEALTLRVKTAVDSVGQLDPDSQSELVAKYKPHVVVIVLDGTAAVGGG
jgi:hypothetical protein